VKDSLKEELIIISIFAKIPFGYLAIHMKIFLNQNKSRVYIIGYRLFSRGTEIAFS